MNAFTFLERYHLWRQQRQRQRINKSIKRIEKILQVHLEFLTSLIKEGMAKKCSCCEQPKLLIDFHFEKYGFCNECKVCAATESQKCRRTQKLLGENNMGNLEKIKQTAEQMPDCLEKEQGLQAYFNLKLFEIIADSFNNIISGEEE